ncbi:MAG: MerR family transcriptional regulator [Candidatus Coprenecus sp.]|nr:MerR family transcriptional regulator [Candidatus Coprenecus sp.]
MPYKEYVPGKIYWSIGEVAQLLNESTSRVRFWTDHFKSFVKPVRNARGDRKYTESDIDALKVIQYLVTQRRMTLEGAASTMKNSMENTAREAQIVFRLRRIQERLNDIAQIIDENC